MPSTLKKYIIYFFLRKNLIVHLFFLFRSWSREGWNSSDIIQGEEKEEYKLTLNDVSSSLVYMYTPITQEGTKGERKHFNTGVVEAGVSFFPF